MVLPIEFGEPYFCDMQYFEIFKFPIQFHIDQVQLNKTYITLQKKYHPDFYGQATEDEQAEALEMSSVVNRAYKTFKNPDRIMQYILTEEGLLEEGEAYKMDPTFLMEVMELNEMKMDDASPETIRERALAMQQDIYNDVAGLVAAYHGEEKQKEGLLKIKDYYYKKKYIDRLLAE